MGEVADWLSDPATEPANTADPFALPGDTPGLDQPSIEVPRADAPYADIKFQVMQGSSRVWACNGRYVACRPSGFNPATRQRHARFLKSGHYEHVGTFDDVQVFRLLPGSPFYRTEGDVRQGSWYELLRAAARAAVARDWGAYVDLLEEIAVRVKSAPTGTESGDVEPELAKQRFMDTLEWLEQLIFMRWSHGVDMRKVEDYGRLFSIMKAEIDAGVSNIRAARGDTRGRVIALPARTVMRIR